MINAFIQPLLAKALFVPLFFTTPFETFKSCTSDNDCNLGFSCVEHQFYNNKICNSNTSKFLTQYTPFFIESYGRMVGCDENMISLLKIVAQRESHNKWWEHHWHVSDMKSIQISRKRLASEYKNSRHWSNKQKWQTYGLFGMNSVNFVYRIDPQLPPQILKHPYFAVLAYKRAADSASQKLRRGVKCKTLNGEVFTFHGSLNNKPSLNDIHAAVSGGSLCPRPIDSKKEQWMKQHASFAYKVKYNE